MSYDRRASTNRTATFNITKLEVDVDVNLDPEKVVWAPNGKVLLTGKATFVLPNNRHKGQPYELEVSEDGTVLRCSCSDPMQEQLIYMAAKARKRELVELIVDQKDRGDLRKKPG
jgi:hypothetical protein